MSLTKAHNRMIEGAAVNVKDFGAKGDGTTDDTTAIQAAINALQNFQVLDFAGGTYFTTDTIDITNKDSIKLMNGKIIRTATSTTSTVVPCFDLDDVNDSIFENLAFDLNNTVTVSREVCFRIDDCDHLTFVKCIFDDSNRGVSGTGTTSTYITVMDCRGTNANSAEEAATTDQGGGALVFGNDLINNASIINTNGSGWNHLVLSGECEAWEVIDCNLNNSGDSAIYLKGSKHIVSGCRVETAGKDGIKILQTTANDGTDCSISNCYINGAGKLKSDGGSHINLESDNSSITGCVIQILGPTTSSLATSSAKGINLSGTNCVVSNCVIEGPGPTATHGETIALLSRTSGRNSSNHTYQNIRVSNTRRACQIQEDATYTVTNVCFADIFGKTVDQFAYIQDSNENIEQVRFDGGGVDGTTTDAMFLGYLTDGVYVRNFDFRNVDSSSACINHRNNTVGYYMQCTEDGNANEIIDFNGGGAGRQTDNSWQYTTTGSPTVTTYNFTGDRYWDTTPSAGGSPGKIVVTAGSPGTLKDMANLAS